MQIKLGAVAGTHEGPLRTIDIEHAAHVGADTGERVQLTAVVDKEAMDRAGCKGVNGALGQLGQACNRDPSPMCSDQSRRGPGHTQLGGSLEAKSRRNAGGKRPHNREHGTAACHAELRWEQARVEALDELGGRLLAASATQQLHEPEHAPVLFRETGQFSARRAISQHRVDGALEALFLGHGTASWLKRTEIGGQGQSARGPVSSSSSSPRFSDLIQRPCGSVCVAESPPHTPPGNSRAVATGGVTLLSIGGTKVASADSVTDVGNAAVGAERIETAFYGNALGTGSPYSCSTDLPKGTILNSAHRLYVNAAFNQESEHLTILESPGLDFSYSHFAFPVGSFQSASAMLTLGKQLESTFIGAYLGAIKAAASAGNAFIAEVAAQIVGIECEHRVPMRDIAGEDPPNDRWFEGDITSSDSTLGNTAACFTVYATASDAVNALLTLGIAPGSGCGVYSAIWSAGPQLEVAPQPGTGCRPRLLHAPRAHRPTRVLSVRSTSDSFRRLVEAPRVNPVE